MKLDFMTLANYAEDNKGLLNVSGGTWDTINVQAPLQAPAGTLAAGVRPVAIMPGYLVIRLLFHVTETGRQRKLRVVMMDADGAVVATLEAEASIDKVNDLPRGWLQGVNVILPLTGIPLPRFGPYSIAVLIDEQHLGDLAFRVERRY